MEESSESCVVPYVVGFAVGFAVFLFIPCFFCYLNIRNWEKACSAARRSILWDDAPPTEEDNNNNNNNGLLRDVALPLPSEDMPYRYNVTCRGIAKRSVELRFLPIEGNDEHLFSIEGVGWVGGGDGDPMPPLRLDITDGMLSLRNGMAYFFEKPDGEYDEQNYLRRKEYGKLLVHGSFRNEFDYFVGKFHTQASFENTYEGFRSSHRRNKTPAEKKSSDNKHGEDSELTARSTISTNSFTDHTGSTAETLPFSIDTPHAV